MASRACSIATAPGSVRSLKDADAERRDFASRTLLVFVLIALLCCLLIGRMVWLTVFKHDEYRTISEKNRIQMVGVAPPRGRIYDRGGNLLAYNVPVFLGVPGSRTHGRCGRDACPNRRLGRPLGRGDRGVSHAGEAEIDPAFADPGEAPHLGSGTGDHRGEPSPASAVSRSGPTRSVTIPMAR